MAQRNKWYYSIFIFFLCVMIALVIWLVISVTNLWSYENKPSSGDCLTFYGTLIGAIITVLALCVTIFFTYKNTNKQLIEQKKNLMIQFKKELINKKYEALMDKALEVRNLVLLKNLGDLTMESIPIFLSKLEDKLELCELEIYKLNLKAKSEGIYKDLLAFWENSKLKLTVINKEINEALKECKEYNDDLSLFIKDYSHVLENYSKISEDEEVIEQNKKRGSIKSKLISIGRHIKKFYEKYNLANDIAKINFEDFTEKCTNFAEKKDIPEILEDLSNNLVSNKDDYKKNYEVIFSGIFNILNRIIEFEVSEEVHRESEQNLYNKKNENNGFGANVRSFFRKKEKTNIYDKDMQIPGQSA